MQDFDSRNLIIAMVLAFAILFGSQYLFPHPKTQQLKAQANIARTGQPPALSTAEKAAQEQKDRATALKEDGPRLPIETPKLQGSINLNGARFDDLELVGYHETNKANSPWVVLLSPRSAPHAYIAQQGWIAKEQGVKLPDSDTVWQAPAEAKLTPTTPVTLTWDNSAGLKVSREISVDANYMFTIKDTVVNSGTAAVTLMPYAFVTRYGEPPKGGTYLSYEGPLGGFDNGGQEVKYSKIPVDAPVERTSNGGWVGFTDKYWLTAVAPLNQKLAIDARFTHAGTPAGADEKFQADWLGSEEPLKAGGQRTSSSYFFAGAKEVRLINAYGDNLGLLHFDTAVDWGWFYFLTKPIFYLLDALYGWVGNFGIAILMLTVIIKALFFPLANRAFVNMAKMKQLAPQMQALKEKFGDDKLRMQQETMALYKKMGANPVLGCLPVLLQIPVFFSLYKVLYNTIEMRHAPFYGWIRDLSAPDPTSWVNLFGLLPFSVPHLPLIGGALIIGAWPLIYTATMFLQQKMQPAVPDPVQARMMTFMPIMMGFLLAQLPAGLLIYYSWNNALTIAQQWFITRRISHKVQQVPA